MQTQLYCYASVSVMIMPGPELPQSFKFSYTAIFSLSFVPKHLVQKQVAARQDFRKLQLHAYHYPQPKTEQTLKPQVPVSFVGLLHNTLMQDD